MPRCGTLSLEYADGSTGIDVYTGPVGNKGTGGEWNGDRTNGGGLSLPPNVTATDLCECEDPFESEPVRTESTETLMLSLSGGRELPEWSTEAEEARLEAVFPYPSPTLFAEELRSAAESTLATREVRAVEEGGLP